MKHKQSDVLISYRSLLQVGNSKGVRFRIIILYTLKATINHDDQKTILSQITLVVLLFTTIAKVSQKLTNPSKNNRSISLNKNCRKQFFENILEISTFDKKKYIRVLIQHEYTKYYVT